jgi:hypothetical protein
MNANLMKKTIEMSKTEAKDAGKIGSDKFAELRQYMAEYPGFTIAIKPTAKKKVEFRGLDYKYMRGYILKHDDDDGTIMAEFCELIAQDKKDKVEGAEHLEAASYIDVKKWFLAKFPEIKQYKEEHQKKIEKILAAA